MNMMLQARINNVRDLPAREEGATPRKSVTFVTLDQGDWTETMPADQWNGHKAGDDVILTYEVSKSMQVKEYNGRSYPSASLGLRLVGVEHDK
jgi:hypothetical protein